MSGSMMPSWYFESGKRDRELGNTQPAMTQEDFNREIEDPALAKECFEQYMRGFERR